MVAEPEQSASRYILVLYKCRVSLGFQSLQSVLCPPRAIHQGGLGSKPLECHAEERQCLHVGSEARRDLTPAWSFSCISRPPLALGAAWRAARGLGARAVRRPVRFTLPQPTRVFLRSLCSPLPGFLL